MASKGGSQGGGKGQKQLNKKTSGQEGVGSSGGQQQQGRAQGQNPKSSHHYAQKSLTQQENRPMQQAQGPQGQQPLSQPRPAQQAWGAQRQQGPEQQNPKPQQPPSGPRPTQHAWGAQRQQGPEQQNPKPQQPQSQPQQSQQATQDSVIKTAKQAKPTKMSEGSVSLFPPKPQLKTEKPIYRHGVFVEANETSTDARGPRKLPKDTRLSAVREAIQLWIGNNNVDPSVRNLTYSFVTDSNATIVFALFDMTISSKSLDINVEINVDCIVDRKLKAMKKSFKVKFSDGERLDVRELIDYCAGRGAKNYSSLHDHIRALNTILHGQIITIPALFVNQNKSGIGSIFPFNNQEQFPISQGVFCNRGTTLSVRLTEDGLALNVANTVAPFYEPRKLTDFVRDRYRANLEAGLSPQQIDMLKKDLKNKQVEVLHINYGTDQNPHYKKYRIHDVKGSGFEKFESTDAKGNKFQTTVEAYFAKEYPKFKLKYPKLPCIVDNKRFLPLEVCRIVEKQRVSRKLDPRETSEVIKHAALKPEKHFEQVHKNVSRVGSTSKSFNDFGFQLEQKPIEVEGRELPPIELVSGGTMRDTRSRPVQAMGGEYNIRQNLFCTPVTIKKWCLLILVDDSVARCGQTLKQDALKFGGLYCDAAKSKGVTISPMSEVKFLPPQPPAVLNRLDEMQVRKDLKDCFTEFNQKKYDFVIVLLPERPDWIYGYLQYLETLPDVRRSRAPNESCTRASCIKFENYRRKIIYDNRGGEMFLSNLWLKHNVKLGGANVFLQANQNFGIAAKRVNFLSDGYLFVSIDVCHPAPGDKFMQSVAAMVGMWDITSKNLSHTTRLRVQAKQRSDADLSTVEEVGEVGVMFEEILQTFVKIKGRYPSNVVVLRDGVSEGQFKMVLQYELFKIKAVLSRLAKDSKIACLTVQKRHRVRFMRKTPVQNRRGENDYNIQPGTVVDQKVTHPNDFTFYMAPHKALQGTTKAPYVYMIYDDIGFDLDSAQAMIYALSCLSPRCTKLTSIPTPINLADLAAERGKHIIIAWGSHQANLKSMSQDELLAKLNGHLSNLGDVNYKNTLYYV